MTPTVHNPLLIGPDFPSILVQLGRLMVVPSTDSVHIAILRVLIGRGDVTRIVTSGVVFLVTVVFCLVHGNCVTCSVCRRSGKFKVDICIW